MPSNQLLPNAPVSVWVCPPVGVNADGSTSGPSQTPVGYIFPFSNPSAWRKEPALLPKQHGRRPSAMGTAEFQLLRQTRKDTSDNTPQTYPAVIEGCYVAVQSGTGPLSFANNALWVGWIPRSDGEQVMGTGELIGVMSGRELGDLLDKQQVIGWTRVDGSGSYADSNPLQSVPTANLGSSSGAIIGNAVQQSDGQYLFARIPTQFGYAIPGNNGYTGSDLSKYFTRWRLLTHAVANCMPKALCSSMTILCQDGSQGNLNPTDPTTLSGYLNQTQFPEIFDISQVTWRGLLDLLIPRERDLGWTIIPTDAGVWQIYIYSLAADTSYGVPAVPLAQQYSVTMASYPAAKLAMVKDASDLPDKVLVYGNPCIFNFTVSFGDGNFGIGWNTALNANYFAAASTINPTIYVAMTPIQQQDLNRQYRAQGWLRDVFTRFALLTSNNGDLQIAGTPGVGNSLTYPACPNLIWNKAGSPGLSIDVTTSRMPSLGGKGLLRQLSLQLGFDSTLTDHRAPQQKASPTFMPVRIFAYNQNDYANLVWRDLTVPNPLYGNTRAQIDVDDYGPALRIEYSPRELLAGSVWPQDGSAAICDLPNPAIDQNRVSYTTFVATIAIESDQRVQVQAYRPGLKTTDDSQVRRTLKIFNPNLFCNAIWSGTIIGVTIPATGSTGTATPDRINDPNMTAVSPGSSDGLSFLRNDFGLCALLCQQAGGWAFRPRRSVTMTLLQPSIAPGTIPWATLGALITSAIESATVTTTIGTVVEAVDVIYGSSPRLIVQTTLPPLPTRIGEMSGGGSSPSASAGGAISTAASGTSAQAIQALRAEIIDLQKRVAKIPIQTMVPMAAPDIQRVKIIGGQMNNNVAVITYAADPFTADQNYNPQTATSYIAGLGYGELYSSAGQLLGQVVVRHNYQAFTDPIIAGSVYVVGAPMQIPISGGTQTLTVYPIVYG